MKHHSATITATWIGLNFLPLFVVVILCFILQSWLWSVALILLYLVIFVPYGFFVSLPLMAKIFRRPASLHSR
jgi:hypothetical protein